MPANALIQLRRVILFSLFALPLAANAQIGGIGNSLFQCGIDESARLEPSVQTLDDAGGVLGEVYGQKSLKRVRRTIQRSQKRASNALKKVSRQLRRVESSLGAQSLGSLSSQAKLRRLPNIGKTLSQLQNVVELGNDSGLFDGASVQLDALLRETPSNAADILRREAKSGKQRKAELRRIFNEVKRCKGCASDRNQRRAGARKQCSCVTEEVPGSFEYREATFGVNNSACSITVFVRWTQSGNTNVQSATARYELVNTNTGAGQPRSESRRAPFDNSYGYGTQGQSLDVPSGSNWIAIGGAGGANLSGAPIGGCADLQPGLAAILRNPTVEYTICPQ